ncbi:NAD(P)/FAD-dependent oxidoreductase [Oryzifoliimicrobium ureilyticus]|uniref:NAD(P)/FAD-dependent oxidoreductase n=1 Tax=Oryzifoliimicrobium ureilyticus TaxID=3113724 RepID=UPI003076655B
MSKKFSVAVIGAGIAGLSFAKALHPNAKITIFEKSRGVAGRMATRTRGGFVFDHGAQYFTVREERFRHALASAIEHGPVEPWTVAIASIGIEGETTFRENAQLRFVGTPSMTALGKYWAKDFDVRLNHKATSLRRDGGLWYLDFEAAASEGPFDWVVSSAPAPQTEALLPLPPVHRQKLQAVCMQACFTLMVALADHSELPSAGCQIDHPVLGWIARNDAKPRRDGPACLVVHANNEWSSRNIEMPLVQVQAAMVGALREVLALESINPDLFAELHRWRYANVAKALGEPYLLDEQQRIAACGDWCLGNRVEAAFMSGAILADKMNEMARQNI